MLGGHAAILVNRLAIARTKSHQIARTFRSSFPRISPQGGYSIPRMNLELFERMEAPELRRYLDDQYCQWRFYCERTI